MTSLLEKENGGDLRIDVAVSEDGSVREDLKKYIAELVPENTDVRVYCSYKQGFSWIQDRVIPELLTIEKQGGKRSPGWR